MDDLGLCVAEDEPEYGAWTRNRYKDHQLKGNMKQFRFPDYKDLFSII
jgi:hypothetical protein